MNRTEMKANWIKTNANAFREREKQHPMTVGAIIIGNRVTVVDIACSDCPKIGVAICSPTDTFNLDTGLAIAWARMTDCDIPEFVLRDDAPLMVCVSTLTSGQRFRYFVEHPLLGFGWHEFHMISKKSNGSYKVYDETARKFVSFGTVKNGGKPVEFIED